MRSDDLARLNVAYDAWRVLTPSAAEVEAGVRRVAARLDREPTHRRSPRAVGAGVGAILLGAAAAYAAAGPLRAWWDRRNEPAPVENRELAAKAPVAPAVPAPPGDDDKSVQTVPELESVPPAALPPSRAPGSAPNPSSRPEATTESSWRRIDEALARGDHRSAVAALERLGLQTKDADTRAKARLGLAQLALARGDCAEARRFALEVLAIAGADAKHHRRADAVVARCANEGN